MSKAILFHASFPPGKDDKDVLNNIELAYSPGVGDVVQAIKENPSLLESLTNKLNTVVVITNGTAVLGFGNLGPVAAKTVMESKSALLRSVGFNSYDIEISENDPEKFVEIVSKISIPFGAIMLEDISAPSCFEIEKKLSSKLDLPVMHDDQHGVSIMVCAAVRRWIDLYSIENPKIVCVGAGAAGIATLSLLRKIGISSFKLFDSKGIVTKFNAANMYKYEFGVDEIDTLENSLRNANIFIGVSAPNSVSINHIERMKPNSLVMALANPDPEINPDLIKRHDMLVFTGRSDAKNQINNSIIFPHLFRAATLLNRKIDGEMHLATVNALIKYLEIYVKHRQSKDVCKNKLEYESSGEYLYSGESLVPVFSDPALPYMIPTLIQEGLREMAIESGYPISRKILHYLLKEEIFINSCLQVETTPRTLLIPLILKKIGCYRHHHTIYPSTHIENASFVVKNKDSYLIVSQNEIIANQINEYYQCLIVRGNQVSKYIGCITDDMRFFYNPGSDFKDIIKFSMVCSKIAIRMASE